ncbi:ABC-three component system middle component 2 [Arthrobacter sp. zg-Y1143]|uniref:ABC-three component system middle component 2 n=1 Tax=Arthrobacter sp. zg-Y1143 TaxID=3049065 RepID=UPI0024C26DE2|nr:ABC-three component system middle component 2 [Arthrobacter sp. zg-Y1143]MDK1329125.1 hypothetical protein [Arthrobacter sp. zg-Y1143]
MSPDHVQDHSEAAEHGRFSVTSPEDHTMFRLAQLVILIDEIAPPGAKGLDLERLGYYDFFSANPFAIFGAEDLVEHAQLHRAAFDERQLSYASTGSRFANRRKRLQHDVALLVSYRLVAQRGAGYGISDKGNDFAISLTALYADQYRDSVRVVHKRFSGLSDTQLAAAVRGWLRTPSLLLDLYGAGEAPGEDLIAAQPPRGRDRSDLP